MLQSDRERVIIWGGEVLTEGELKVKKSTKASRLSLVEIGEGLYMAAPDDQADKIEDYMNHSCDPNLWLEDEVTLVAKRDIQPGEELTFDYATCITESLNKYDHELPFECHCGSPLCRKIITDQDWKRKDLQSRYKGHFSPHINQRIKALQVQ